MEYVINQLSYLLSHDVVDDQRYFCWRNNVIFNRRRASKWIGVILVETKFLWWIDGSNRRIKSEKLEICPRRMIGMELEIPNNING